MYVDMYTTVQVGAAVLIFVHCHEYNATANASTSALYSYIFLKGMQICLRDMFHFAFCVHVYGLVSKSIHSVHVCAQRHCVFVFCFQSWN